MKARTKPGEQRLPFRPLLPVNFSMVEDEIHALDELAWLRRLSRSELLRQLVRQELAKDRQP